MTTDEANETVLAVLLALRLQIALSYVPSVLGQPYPACPPSLDSLILLALRA